MNIVPTIVLRDERGDTCSINKDDVEQLRAWNEKGYFSEEQWAEAEAAETKTKKKGKSE